MKTEDVVKLPKVKIYLLRLTDSRNNSHYFCSTDRDKIELKLNEFAVKDDLDTFKVHESFAYNTFESDENYIHDTLASFKNFLK